MAFAEGTEVPVERTRGAIEALVRQHGATEFSSGYTAAETGCSFVVQRRRVQFSVNKPTVDNSKRVRERAPRVGEDKAVAEEERRLWRCLLLAIKSKLETVASGISTFEEEFLAHIVTEGGQTIYQRILEIERTSGRKLLGPAEP